MAGNRLAACIVMLASVFWPRVAAVGGDSSASEEWQAAKEEQEYQQELAAIKAFQESLSHTEANDLAKYKEFADPIQKKWSQRNREHYARLMLAICDPLSWGQFSDAGQHDLAREYALSALADPDAIPLTLESELTRHVMSLWGGVELPKGEELTQRRRKDIETWLHTWKRNVDAVDPTWDPEEVMSMQPDLPRGVQGFSFSGMPPELIEDPVVRAQYEANIEEHHRKAVRHNEQSDVRQWLSFFPGQVERHIILFYSKPPYDLAELKELLKDSVADDAMRARILDAVAKRTGEESPSASAGSSTGT